MSASKVSKSFEVLILGRLVFGLFCGLVMSLNPLYIQEVSPTILRGAFATLNQVSFASGILVGMVSIVWKTFSWMSWILISSCLPAVRVHRVIFMYRKRSCLAAFSIH